MLGLSICISLESLSNTMVKAMFILTVFEMLLLEGRSVLWPVQGGTESKRVKFTVKNVRLLFDLLKKRLSYKFRRF